VPDPDAPLLSDIEIELGSPALIPDDYVYDIHQRLIFYKRISNATLNSSTEKGSTGKGLVQKETLDEIRVELIDRFGLLPDYLKNLFLVTEVKRNVEDMGINSIEVADSGIKIKFGDKPNINPVKLIEMIQVQSSKYHFDGKQTFRILNPDEEIDQRVKQIYDVINTLSLQDAA
jgi:transcription-repair coupling factor (superfamily II helicase)